jgi:hypothetical protein
MPHSSPDKGTVKDKYKRKKKNNSVVFAYLPKQDSAVQWATTGMAIVLPAL